VKVVLSVYLGTLDCRNYQNLSGDCTIDCVPYSDHPAHPAKDHPASISASLKTGR